MPAQQIEASEVLVARDRSGSPAENEFADAIGPVPKVVFSRSLRAVGWNGRVVHEDPAEEVRRLREQSERLLIQASPSLAAHLRNAGLVDRCRFLLQPLAAGDGPTLFEPGETARLTLERSAVFVSGTVALDYSIGSRSRCPGAPRARTRIYVVVGTGVDPVTFRFSDSCRAIS